MKKIVISILFFLMFIITEVQAYNIGGEFATLTSCQWGKYGYQYGNIGTYKTASGEIYQVFFGLNFCQY